jgi:hypothetical protein
VCECSDAVGDELGLEGVDEALGHGVVVGVANRADAGENAVVVEDLLEGEAGVLPEFKGPSQRCRLTRRMVVPWPAVVAAVVSVTVAAVTAEAA